jgi:GntR family transcriptional regulator, transcriptional repressor for pyruvate dehydrogenase complex
LLNLKEILGIHYGGITPVQRQSLPDDLAARVRTLIHARNYTPGDRLPTIAEMARDFGVGAPTVREAMRKLEALGVVDIRHGSGIYVGAAAADSLLISNPVFAGAVSKTLLLDLIEARIPVEIHAVALAAANATEDDLAELDRLLDRAAEALDDGAALNRINLAFHQQIAVSSGNQVLRQLLAVLGSLFLDEQRMILDIHGSRRQDLEEHRGIVEALRAGDVALSSDRMRMHLEGVRKVIQSWNPA